MNQIRKIREKKGLGREELARKAGISVFTLSRIERGETPGRTDEAISIANALGTSVEKLFPKNNPEERRGGEAG